MKKRQTLRALAGVSMLLSSVIATGVFSTTATATTTSVCNPALANTSGKININFWESASGTASDATTPESVMVKLVNAFNASQTKIHVNDVSQQSSTDGTWTPYVQSLANGTQPDILYFDNYQNQQASDSTTFIPVSACIAASKYSTADFLKKAIGQQTIKGQLMGMPFAMSAPVMYYNLQAFKKAKIAAPPKTFAELAIDAAKLKAAGYKDGISVKNDPWWLQIWNGMSDQYYVNQQNGRTGRATAAAFNNATSLALVTDIHNMVKAGTAKSFPGTGVGLAAFNNLFDIANDNSGITFDTSSALGTIGGYLPLFKNVTLGVAPLPTLTSAATNGVQPGGQTLYIPKNTSAAKVAAAWVFMQYMVSAKTMATWDAGTGYNPVRASAAADPIITKLWASKPYYKVAYNEIIAGTTTNATVGPLVGPYLQVNDAVANALATIFTDPNSNPATQLKAAESAANAAIAAYNAAH